MEKPTTTSKSKNKLFKLFQKAIKNLPRKNKKANDGDGGQMVKNSSFGEPISPKISCIGQIKQRKKLAKNVHLFLHKEMCPAMASRNNGSLMKPTFFLPEAEKIPSNMRNTHINNNGWKIAQIQGDDDMDDWKCNYQYSEEDDEEDEKIHFSAPLIMVGGRDDHVQELEPRKEVNLWRRRMIDQPKPLQIRPPCTSLSVLRSRCQ